MNTKNKIINQTLRWIGAFVGIADNLAVILSLGFYLPTWNMQFSFFHMNLRLKYNWY